MENACCGEHFRRFWRKWIFALSHSQIVSTSLQIDSRQQSMEMGEIEVAVIALAIRNNNSSLFRKKKSYLFNSCNYMLQAMYWVWDGSGEQLVNGWISVLLGTPFRCHFIAAKSTARSVNGFLKRAQFPCSTGDDAIGNTVSVTRKMFVFFFHTNSRECACNAIRFI